MSIIDWLTADSTTPNWMLLLLSLGMVALLIGANWMLNDAINRLRVANEVYDRALDLFGDSAGTVGAEAVRDALNNGSS